ncbi:hypothetical protein A2690_04870 [Candidatus Roizmanbacteria bacterium RIFCSPHIGHO2_01_FULL_39_12b]|uniref:Dockerin domain-containing protein n=1 Tax=Candidatus Roizmanbacteria bacterium RIFCSPHIGHO2_01_FULL_39_12b TaxID=1802030 RepID=A0A1F7GCY7_9BACT|nr:MAG: hypothetical protein A2690_04870 [Candidatus Roizmanbacteria bacterium RIFCSPHIGHO2_01_FULL_39_12b]
MNVFDRIKSSRGELTITLAIASLIIMVLGSVIGTRVSDRRVLTNQTSAAGTIACGGFGCSKNSDCAQNLGFTVLCHKASGQCRPMSAQQSCPGGGSPRIDKVRKNEGESCSTTLDCKTGLICTGFPRVCTGQNPPTPTNRAGIIPTFSAPTPTGGGGGGGGGGSCIFAPTAFVNIRSVGASGQGERLTVALDSGVTSWRTQNDKQKSSPGSPSTSFGPSGEIKASENIAGKTTCCGGYPVTTPPSTATVELVNFDTTKYKIVETCGPDGCAPAPGTGRVIGGLPIACSTYSYGWVLECNSVRNCPLTQEIDVTRFQTSVGKCEATFTQVADPTITKITIGRPGGPDLFAATSSTPKTGGNGQIPFTITFRNQSVHVNYDPGPNPNNPNDVAVNYNNSNGAFNMTYGRQGLIPGTGADPMVVTLDYYIERRQDPRDPRSPLVRHNFRQSITTRGGCESPRETPTPTTTQTPTPTTTQTPTPTPLICNSVCDPNNDRCPAGTKCLKPEGETEYRCRLESNPTNPRCEEETVCRELKVNFIIDISSSVRSYINTIQGTIPQALQTYIDTHPQTNLTFYWSFFDYKWRPGGSHVFRPNERVGQLFSIPNDHHWTNILEGLDTGLRPNAIDFLFTDGYPTVTNWQGGFKCVSRDNTICWADPCLPVDGGSCPSDVLCKLYKNAPGRPNTCPDAGGRCTSCDGATRDTVERALANKYGRQVDYVVKMAGEPAGERMLQTLVSTPDNLINVENLSGRLSNLLTQECSQQGNREGRAQATNAGYSMRIDNQSTNRTIESVSIGLCDENAQCENKTINRPILSGEKDTESALFSGINGVPLDKNSQYQMKCAVTYDDGESESCGETDIAGDDGVQYRLIVDDDGLSGQPVTYLEASDIDGNGSVNTLDYARCLKQSDADYNGEITACDIVIDDKVNAQDRSVIINNVGKN